MECVKIQPISGRIQFLLDCVKSPSEACLYNRTFGYVDISPEEVGIALSSTSVNIPC